MLKQPKTQSITRLPEDMDEAERALHDVLLRIYGRTPADMELANWSAKLAGGMTARQFDHGYWYATEIKRFSRAIGVPAAHKLRKDELEKIIRHFLTHGRLTGLPRRDLSLGHPLPRLCSAFRASSPSWASRHNSSTLAVPVHGR